MASIVLGNAQRPGEFTRGNFTRTLEVKDGRSGKLIEYEHRAAYGGSG